MRERMRAAPNTEPNIMPRRAFVGSAVLSLWVAIGAAATVGVVVALVVASETEVLVGVADTVDDDDVVDEMLAAKTFWSTSIAVVFSHVFSLPSNAQRISLSLPPATTTRPSEPCARA